MMIPGVGEAERRCFFLCPCHLRCDFVGAHGCAPCDLPKGRSLLPVTRFCCRYATRAKLIDLHPRVSLECFATGKKLAAFAS